jgi:hypothetical protein
MGWKNGNGPRLDLDRSAIEDTVDKVLDQASGSMLKALERGTPVDTGEARASWLHVGGESEHVVKMTAPHARFVDVDTSGADVVVKALDTTMASTIDHLFGG